MTGWEGLTDELDAWSSAGRVATLWWRDDDATRASPDLERLLDLSDRFGVPVALAVIPRDIDPSLTSAIVGRAAVATLQHGWSHDDHAVDGDRKEEHGPDRPRDVVLDELAEGWRRIRTLPGSLPVYVAPWNRLDPSLISHLPSVGLHAVSTDHARSAAEPEAGVRRTNIHCDPIDWHGGGRFGGDEAALRQVIEHLANRRTNRVDAYEPTGLMTHHQFHDPECWTFVGRLLAHTLAHPAARWLSARDAFWPDGDVPTVHVAERRT